MHVEIAAKNAKVFDTRAFQGFFNVTELIREQVIAGLGTGHGKEKDKFDVGVFGGTDVITGMADFIVGGGGDNEQFVDSFEGFSQAFHIICIDGVRFSIRTASFNGVFGFCLLFSVDSGVNFEILSVGLAAKMLEDVNSGLTAGSSNKNLFTTSLLLLLRGLL